MAESVPSPALLEILGQIASGTLSPDDAAAHVTAAALSTSQTDVMADESESPDLAPVDGALVDLDRASRCGFGEVIFGEGKTTELMRTIVQAQQDVGQPCLITRINPTSAAQLRRAYPDSSYNAAARTLRIGSVAEEPESPSPHVAVVTAGSTDAGVAEEAIETLRWMKVAHRRYDDLGVAGPQRLLASVPKLREASAIVVAAGMEGALPAVVAGHVATPVIAVPTSVGYGVHLSGLTPLMAMLTSCAANVAVVNIDAGFKGGYMAGLIVSTLRHDK